MNDIQEVGSVISKLRKQSGLSQKKLAEALNITDKAVSKWERGLSLPDISLLPKLSSILDSDIEPLLSGLSVTFSHKWKGVLVLDDDFGIDLVLYDKPAVYYTISCFMLVGISEIIIKTTENGKKKIKQLFNGNERQLGLKFHFVDEIKNSIYNDDVFEIKGLCFVFAASLTRQFQAFMISNEHPISIIQSNSKSTVLTFYAAGTYPQNEKTEKKLSRGTIYIQLDSFDAITEVSSFIKFYENKCGHRIADLQELAINRNMIKK